MTDLHEPELYANRELSWLDFNQRVLELAEDDRLPLLERVRFLGIFTSGLDEFFMIRVAGVHDQVDAGIDARGPDGMSPPEVLKRIIERTRELQARQSRVWEQDVRSALADEGIRIIDCSDCDQPELERVDQQFAEQIFPVLTPLAVGPGRPFPYISNLSLSLAVWLRDPESGQETFARVKVPKEVLPRFISIGNGAYVPLEAAIARHLSDLFPGMEILRHDYFRVTRDADFTVSDEADDLLQAVEDELRRRRFGEVVRLEVGESMDPDLRARLIEWLVVEESDVIDVEGLLDLEDLNELVDMDGQRELRFEPWTPTTPPPFSDPGDDGHADLFATMRERDLLVQHPYDSFAGSVERFVQHAVADPDVLAIKMTVYRTSDDSALVPSLIEAAERGKQAVCLVELKARFDERRNIGWARALEEAGAHVVHGLPGLKTHAKALLVVRREGSGVGHYVHVGTGNYHAKTARIYEDLGLFTTDAEIAADVAELFNSLTGVAHSPSYRKAVTAPDHLRSWFIEQVEQTIRAHESGQETRIVAKMNSLVDARSIRALYQASQAGVRVDLNVRGICCLRPGIEGVSENIRVVSVVGRFLEHARVYSFQRGDERLYWMGSADLMPRNLDTRVELLVPVEDPELQAELDYTLDACLEDDTFGWELQSDGSWSRRTGNTRAAQLELMERALARARSESARLETPRGDGRAEPSHTPASAEPTPA